MLKETDAISRVAVKLVCLIRFAAFKWLLEGSCEMTGRVFAACINSTDSLIPLLGLSGRPDASPARWCITVGVTTIFAFRSASWFTNGMSLRAAELELESGGSHGVVSLGSDTTLQRGAPLSFIVTVLKLVTS